MIQIPRTPDMRAQARPVRPATPNPEHLPGEATACRDLWATVLRTCLVDILVGPESDAVKTVAAQAHWLDSRDFQTVCHLAGIDPAAVAQRIRRAIAEGGEQELARDLGRLLRKGHPSDTPKRRLTAVRRAK